MTDVISYYEVLEVDPGADTDTIQGAATKQQRKWQQRQNAPTLERRRQAEDRVRLIDLARQELLDPDRRRRHDDDLAAAAAPPPPAPTAVSTPASTAPPPPPAVDWQDRARRFLQAGDVESAAYAAREATERAPSDAGAWAVRGAASRAGGLTREALFEFREAIRLDRRPEYVVALAGELEKAGRLGEAAQSWQEAAHLRADEPVYPVNVARLMARQGQLQEAVALLHDLRLRFPERTEVSAQLAWVLSERVHLSWSVLKDGTSMPTSALQVEMAQRDLAEALALPGVDGELGERLLTQSAVVEDVTGSQWYFPPKATNGLLWLRRIGWFLLGWFALAVPQGWFPGAEWLGTVVGLIFLGAVVWGFVKLYRRPRWQVLARSGAVGRPGI